MCNVEKKDSFKTRAEKTRMGKAYQLGSVEALLKVGYTIPEIAEILGIGESSVQAIANLKESV